MKHLRVIIVLLFFLPIFLFSQEKHINWIILVDNKVAIGVSESQFILEYKNEKIETMPVKLIPGDIIISEADFEKIKSDNTSKITLKFEYNEICKDVIYYHYAIPVETFLFDEKWVILKIYNTSKKEIDGCISNCRFQAKPPSCSDF